MKKLLLLYLIFCGYLQLYAQENSIHFNTTNGLPHDITYGIFQDKNGFIWIGTDDGLVKYDGQDFKLFSSDEGLRSNFVIAINQAKNGDILVATWGGGLHVIRNDKIIPVVIPDDESEKINNLQIWDDNIVVKQSIGNVLYEKTANGYIKKNITLKNNTVVKERFNRDGGGSYYLTIINNTPFFLNDIKPFYQNIIIETPGLYKINGKKTEAVHPFFSNKLINSISSIGKNNYIVSINDSLFFVHNNTIQRTIDLNLTTDCDIVCKIKPYNKNEFIVLVSNKKGFKKAYLYDQNFTQKTDLSTILNIQSTISDFLVDHENNIWITTNGEGVYCYNKNLAKFKNITREQLPESLILDIDEMDKTNYFLTPNYLVSFKNQLPLERIKLNGIGKKISVLNNDTLLINSLHLRKGIVKNKIKEIGGYNLISLGEKKNIYIIDSIYIEYLNKKIPKNKGIIYDAIYYRDTLWFASNIGMYYYDNKVNKIVKKQLNGKKLLSEHVRKLTFHNQKLWVATNKGLNAIKGKTIEQFTQKKGLISNQINCMIVDHNGKIWLGTNRGISIFDGKNFINITTSRGLLSPFVNTLFENYKNEILVGSDKGVTIINNNLPLQLEKAPLIYCQQKNTTFNYTVISYNRSNSLNTEYKLNNLSWIPLNSSKGTLDFSKEKKGTYTVQFRAKKQDGVWGYSRVYPFSISIPWYKDIKYIVVLILLISGIIIFIILNQLQKVKKRNNDLKESLLRQKQLEEELTEVRTNIAQDFHDDLGNKLARISVISNIALSEVSSENDKLKSKIEQIQNDANYLYKGTKDFIFSLKDDSNYLEELVTYLSDFGEDLFVNTKSKFVVEKSIDDNIKLPHYWSKQLIFIFKEALTNVYKHANCSTVLFAFHYHKKTLTIKCLNDGERLTEQHVLKSNGGLKNMKKRAEKIAGQITIESDINGWTSIIFTGKTT